MGLTESKLKARLDDRSGKLPLQIVSFQYVKSSKDFSQAAVMKLFRPRPSTLLLTLADRLG
jgi:hypothetical protein